MDIFAGSYIFKKQTRGHLYTELFPASDILCIFLSHFITMQASVVGIYGEKMMSIFFGTSYYLLVSGECKDKIFYIRYD